MKKWMVFLAVIVMAVPAMAADWQFSGSQRMATFWNHYDYGDFTVNGEDDDLNLTEDAAYPGYSLYKSAGSGDYRITVVSEISNDKLR